MGPRAISRECNEVPLPAKFTSTQPSWGSALRIGCTRTLNTTVKFGARASAVREARVAGSPDVESGTMKESDRADEDPVSMMGVEGSARRNGYREPLHAQTG
jgi:hypothetical protein